MNQYQMFWIRGMDGGRFLLPVFIPAVIWSLIWKGLALYRSARNEQKGWFIVLLVLNTMGILEILYLLLFSNLQPAKKKKGKTS